MNILSVLVMVGLLACSPLEPWSSQGGGGNAPAVQLEKPEAGEGPSEDWSGSMCELYGPTEIESVAIPVMCNPYYHYEGYPADQPGPDLPEAEVPRGDNNAQ